MDMHPRLAIKDKIGYRELIGKLENVMEILSCVCVQIPIKSLLL